MLYICMCMCVCVCVGVGVGVGVGVLSMCREQLLLRLVVRLGILLTLLFPVPLGLRTD